MIRLFLFLSLIFSQKSFAQMTIQSLSSHLKSQYKEDIPWFVGQVACKKIYQTTTPFNNNAKFDENKFFNKIKWAIANAQNEVIISTYAVNLGKDAKGNQIYPKSLSFLKEGITQLKERLKKDQKKSKVNILLLADQNMVNDSQKWLKEMTFIDGPTDEINLSIKVFDHKLFGSSHSKIFIIDGQTMMITGANILEHKFKEGGWFDQSFWLLSEDMAKEIRNRFITDLWKEAKAFSKNPVDLKTDEKFSPNPNSLPCRTHARIKANLALIYRKPNKLNLTNSLNGRTKGLLAAMDLAKKSLKILSPALNADDAVKAIQRAIERGVRVEIILTADMGEANQNKAIIGGGVNSKIAYELKDFAAKKKGNLSIKFVSRDGVNPAFKANMEASHSKLMIIDESVIILGSSNMDSQSWYRSGETDVAIDLITPNMNNTIFTKNIIQRGFDSLFSRAVEIETFKSKYYTPK